MPGAVLPFERLRDRLRPSDADGRRHRRAGEGAEGEPALESKPGPTERLFPHRHRELWNKVLDELGMKKDREGNARTAYSLRHTYISMRLMEGADIYQVAKKIAGPALK